MRPQLNYDALLSQLAGTNLPMPPGAEDPRPNYDSESFRTHFEQLQPFAPELKGGAMESYAKTQPNPLTQELLMRR